MIDFLRGYVVCREPEYIVLDVRGVGYRVFCPNPLDFPERSEEVTVYVHHHVREDAILLYGFRTREEQRLFRQLLEVSGIGPRVAVGILSGGSPDAVIQAIRQENVTFLTQLPGIGKKTAQRIILDLKDKLGRIPADVAPPFPSVGAESAGSGRQAGATAWAEAREALLALGYTEAEADRTLRDIRDKADGTETADAILKRALRNLYAG